MRTEDLVALLATGEVAVDRRALARRHALLATGGLAVAFLVTALGIGLRAGILRDLTVPMFWVRELFCALLGVSGVVAFLRLSRPGARVGLAWAGIGAALGGMWLLALGQLALAPPEARLALLLGQTALVCPFLIALVALPVFVALLAIAREMAPTRLRLVGALAGFGAGAVGALIYTLHCPELAAPFLGVWYVLGMLIPTLAGTLLGPAVLRW